ncbi:hypothetical protein ACF09Y_24265 [Streptomyces massasporeus]|uniref:hypothetical protein n=1 Tax=Streptomyces TaxID=1883 RepID=UPI001C8CB737|nr:hypothetical protein [Streptomyces sp. WAC04114]MBX9364373.1 hypothetical protein [Streptomyces sp. WAC04114]
MTITDAAADDGALHLKLMAENVDRVDVYLDQRPRASVDLIGGQADLLVPGAASAHTAHLEGFEVGRLVASTTRDLP